MVPRFLDLFDLVDLAPLQTSKVHRALSANVGSVAGPGYHPRSSMKRTRRPTLGSGCPDRDGMFAVHQLHLTMMMRILFGNQLPLPILRDAFLYCSGTWHAARGWRRIVTLLCLPSIVICIRVQTSRVDGDIQPGISNAFSLSYRIEIKGMCDILVHPNHAIFSRLHVQSSINNVLRSFI